MRRADPPHDGSALVSSALVQLARDISTCAFTTRGSRPSLVMIELLSSQTLRHVVSSDRGHDAAMDACCACVEVSAASQPVLTLPSDIAIWPRGAASVSAWTCVSAQWCARGSALSLAASDCAEADCRFAAASKRISVRSAIDVASSTALPNPARTGSGCAAGSVGGWGLPSMEELQNARSQFKGAARSEGAKLQFAGRLCGVLDAEGVARTGAPTARVRKGRTRTHAQRRARTRLGGSSR
jgi:hypothetical protein